MIQDALKTNADKLTSGVSVPMRWIDFGLSFFLLGVCALITFPMVMGWVRTPVTSLFKPLVISSTPGSGFPVNSHLAKHFNVLLKGKIYRKCSQENIFLEGI